MAAPLSNCTEDEMKSVIRFLNAECVPLEEMCRRMKEQYGDKCLSRLKIYQWVEQLKKKNTNSGEEEKPSAPSTSATTTQKTPEAIAKEKKRSFAETEANILKIVEGTGIQVVTKKINFRKERAKRIAQKLSGDVLPPNLEPCTTILPDTDDEEDDDEEVPQEPNERKIRIPAQRKPYKHWYWRSPRPGSRH